MKLFRKWVNKMGYDFEIDFSETDMDYIHSFYPSDIAENLIKLAGTDENIDNPKTKEGIEEALYQLKAIAENKYNMNYYRILVYCLYLINERNYCGDFDYMEEGE